LARAVSSLADLDDDACATLAGEDAAGLLTPEHSLYDDAGFVQQDATAFDARGFASGSFDVPRDLGDEQGRVFEYPGDVANGIGQLDEILHD
jgi:hypothetical protein